MAWSLSPFRFLLSFGNIETLSLGTMETASDATTRILTRYIGVKCIFVERDGHETNAIILISANKICRANTDHSVDNADSLPPRTFVRIEHNIVQALRSSIFFNHKSRL